ncbi:MAG TPA: hypothetical protein VKU02_02015 [Gemmataceae bacterium]|nr:hypothetical protein [Gemmataceae bacterium]
MASVATPDWLAQRGGAVQVSTKRGTWLVLLEKSPQYRLVPIPAAGKYGCEVTQTVSGCRLEGSGTYPTPEDAVRGGLEDLRRSLGW